MSEGLVVFAECGAKCPSMMSSLNRRGLSGSGPGVMMLNESGGATP